MDGLRLAPGLGREAVRTPGRCHNPAPWSGYEDACQLPIGRFGHGRREFDPPPGLWALVGRRRTRRPRTSVGVWHQDENGRVHTPLEPVVLAATLCLIPIFILEFDASGGWKDAAYAANWLVWGVFAVEFAAIMIVAQRKLAALRAHWLDLIVVGVTIPLFSQLLASLRFVRFARLLRFMRATAIVTRAMQAERRLTSPQLFRAVGAPDDFRRLHRWRCGGDRRFP
jgi:hypothetical protein